MEMVTQTERGELRRAIWFTGAGIEEVRHTLLLLKYSFFRLSTLYNRKSLARGFLPRVVIGSPGPRTSAEAGSSSSLWNKRRRFSFMIDIL